MGAYGHDQVTSGAPRAGFPWVSPEAHDQVTRGAPRAGFAWVSPGGPGVAWVSPGGPGFAWVSPVALTVVLAALACLGGCGARTLLDEGVDSSVRERLPEDERCDGLDQDLDGAVDEDFRDELGRYVTPRHCGACGAECVVPNGFTLEMDCLLLDENPVCGATRCVPGSWPSRSGRCVPAYTYLCLPCTLDEDCGPGALARCADIGGERRCTVACEVGCPPGYACQADGSCAPEGGSCSCEPGDFFELACVVPAGDDPPEAPPLDPPGPLPPRCPGRALCDGGVLSECLAPAEACNESDDDCDGAVDEDFRNDVGGYSDLHHCGACGVDCSLAPVPEGDLVCGGDPFAPSCVLSCPDTLDGIQPGDRVDGDRDIATGCECTVSGLNDVPGPVGASGAALDVNCDGADGEVTRSFYVAPDGDDSGPGSPTRPLATIGAALLRALPEARADVFVASGTYVEALTLPSGARLHGGYRRDFLALDPVGFTTVVRAPLDTPLPGGAALASTDCAAGDSVVEWLSLRGRDALEPSAPAIAVWLACTASGRSLRLDTLDIRPGIPGSGVDGVPGAPGASPLAPPLAGAPPRGALEDNRRTCLRSDANVVAGGAGGQHSCAGASTDGGDGASAGCPIFAAFQPDGERGDGRAPGAGGPGGQDSSGPVVGSSCATAVCCGLADFVVPSFFTGPGPGTAGANGTPGTPGRGCSNPLGRFTGGAWIPATSTGGTAGTAASGGGGGGAGGGAEMEFFPGVCEFPDGLGGGGGGGGAGGCGGSAGSPGTSGGPAVAIYIDDASAPGLVVRGSLVVAPDGGGGGDGGAGGGGGAGSPGAAGGAIPLAERVTPTLAGPFPGERGGSGGRGGDGGGGGGGCGGPSVGIWGGSAADAARFESANTFSVGRGGRAGRGGGGAAMGGSGAEGGSFDVLAR